MTNNLAFSLIPTASRTGANVDHVSLFPANNDQLSLAAARTRIEINCLLATLAVLFVLDGLLTALGLHIFGTGMEGNVLIRSLINGIGTVPALLTVKSLSLLVLIALYWLSPYVRWLRSALRGVVALYLVVAIIPWSSLLIQHLWL